jgi:hypothetical protein
MKVLNWIATQMAGFDPVSTARHQGERYGWHDHRGVYRIVTLEQIFAGGIAIVQETESRDPKSPRDRVRHTVTWFELRTCK